ncbi:MAG: 50S ribosomal protein L25/general stress protein Ctc [Helicobacteraceae bacterium]
MLEGIIRESTERAYTKTLKKDGYLIANLYGNGAGNINCAFKKNDFIRYVKNKDKLVFEVKLDKKKYPVIIQEYQKDPVTSDLVHIDLRIVGGDKKQKFMIPVKTVGTPKGLKNRGVFVMMHRRLPVVCAPKDLPDFFELDVTNLDVDDSIIVRDITAPKGVAIKLGESVAVVGVIKAK